MRAWKLLAASVCILAVTGAAARGAQDGRTSSEEGRAKAIAAKKDYGSRFKTSDRCVACHNGLKTPEGEDISIGIDWKTSLMANAGRDPYWMAGVRRETIDHPTASKAIQDECSICHMPMMRYEAKMAGGEGQVFVHLPPNPKKLDDRLAADGVSCSVCHQITDEGLGTRASFVGGFRLDEGLESDHRHEYGPYDVDAGHATIMRSSTRFQPTEEPKTIRSSELCATCHTLYTNALNERGEVVGELPEQVPYLEWLHSGYSKTSNCQSCHMPVVREEVAITSVFGEPRAGFSRHIFVGGNFFMQRLLNAHRSELSVAALPQDLDAAANRTIEHLKTQAARIAIRNAEEHEERIDAVITVENLSGHKLPTAYPSRRAWLHVVLRDRNGSVIFESGALNPDGSITGNDNDADPTKFEPHYTEITSADQVQIYESIMGDSAGKPTTGLLTARDYLKDNRLLPAGFDKRTADKDVAVRGGAADDDDFAGGGDTIRYSMPTGGAVGPFQVEAELWYQPIAYRWAMNLKPYDAMEPKRFVGYYEEMAKASGVVLAHASCTVGATGGH